MSHSVFVFDAWAHQGDPLRRVFLEELIAKLSRDDAVEPAYWNLELEKLRSKRKKTIEQKAEKLSAVAKVAVLTLPFYPLAYALILQYFIPSSEAHSLSVPYLGDVPIWLVGLTIAAAPYLAALVVWLHWRNWQGPYWYRTREEKKGKSIVTAFTRQTDHVVTEQFIREDEATTVEFNEKFDELSASALGRRTRIVIILDNLDRLTDHQIKEIWGTMRNFFVASPGSARHEALKNIWLIVPVDRKHIESVFADARPKDARRGFIEKTFEIVLRVPPPLLSNWEKFLREKLAEAFVVKISQSEAYRIFQFFDLYNVAHPEILTPRSIKAYVNGIVAQSKLSGNAVPLEYQALYSLYRHEIVADIRKLENSSVLDDVVRVAVSSPQWTMFLAACHFGTKSPEEALELLLAPGVESALIEQDLARLAALKETSGFELVLHQVVRRRRTEWAGDSPNQFLDVVAVIDGVNLSKGATDQHIWSDLQSAVRAITKPIEPSDARRRAVRALVVHGAAADQRPTAKALAASSADSADRNQHGCVGRRHAVVCDGGDSGRRHGGGWGGGPGCRSWDV